MSGQKFTLSFSKRVEKIKLEPSAIRSEPPSEAAAPAPQTLHAIEGNSLKIDESEAEKQLLVIPLVQDDRVAILKRAREMAEGLGSKKQKGEEKRDEEKEKEEEPRVLTLDEQAASAVLEESQRKLETWNERETGGNFTIAAASQDDGLAAPLGTAAKEATLDDYEEIQVSSFGAAMLRGMGWKKDEGVGRMGKRVVEIIDPTTLNFNLAGTRARPGEEGKGAAQEVHQEGGDLLLVKGSHVFLHSGRHRGTYGVIETVDEDHVLVKAAVTQAVIREVELNLRVVTALEFKDSSRVINKDMYDKYKEDEARKKGELLKKKSKNSDSSDNTPRDNRKEDGSERRAKKKHKDSPEGNEKSASDEKSHDKSRSDRDESKDIKQKLNMEYKDKSERNRDRDDKYSRQDKERCRDRDDKDSRQEEERKTKRNVSKDEEFRKDKHTDKERLSDRDKYDDHKRDSLQGELGRVRGSHNPQTGGKSTGKREWEDERHRDIPRSVRDSKSKTKRNWEEDKYSQSSKKAERVPVVVPWVRENLRCRLISKTYKGGKYHKEKVIVRSVMTVESCECEAENGRLLEEVHPAWLETVIPKVPPQVVMIVKGDSKGQRARILQLHKDQEKASIQLLEDETTLMKLHYDDICEYVHR